MADTHTTPARRTLIAGGGALAVLGGVIGYSIDKLVPILFDLGKETYQLKDSERDFVFKVIDLEAKQDKEHLVAVAALVQSNTDRFIRDKKTADALRDSLTIYAQTMAGAKLAEAQEQAKDSSAPPDLGQAAQLVGQAQFADQLSTASAPAPIAPTVATPVAPKPGQGVARVFFQMASDADRPAAEATMNGLSSLGPAWRVASGIELVKTYGGPTEVRYFFQQDRGRAALLARRLSASFPDVKCLRIAGYDTNGRVNPLLFEVWLAKGAKPAAKPGPEKAVDCA